MKAKLDLEYGAEEANHSVDDNLIAVLRAAVCTIQAIRQVTGRLFKKIK